jgi:hypothetical protein
MKRTLLAIITVSVATVGSLVALTAVTLRRIANMRLTQYAYDTGDSTPAGIE